VHLLCGVDVDMQSLMTSPAHHHSLPAERADQGCGRARQQGCCTSPVAWTWTCKVS